MSVQYVKNNTLGSLGTIASLAGTLTGQPWLTALGTGVNAYDAISAGNGYQTPGFLNSNNGGILGSLGLGSLFSNSITSNPDDLVQRGK